jgi:hypothetical protein
MKFEIPYASGIDIYKLGQGKVFPFRSRDLMDSTIREHGGKNFKLEDDHLYFEVPYEEADSVIFDLKENMKLDKTIGKVFNFKKLVKYPVQKGSKKKEAEPERWNDPDWAWNKEKPEAKTEPKERGRRDERKKKPKADKPAGGFRVEIPLNPRGLMRRLRSNPHIKTLVEEFGGTSVKGDDLIFEFPDRSKRSEILDELTDAINTSGFLREVLDTAEI